MFKLAAFGDLSILAYCIMTNHVHILMYVPERKAVTDNILIQRLRFILPNNQVEIIARQLQDYRSQSNDAAAESLKNQFTYRMYDISEFFKALKQQFSQFYNTRNERRGPLWEQRFKSVLLEPCAKPLLAVAAYIELNPIRAGPQPIQKTIVSAVMAPLSVVPRTRDSACAISWVLARTPPGCHGAIFREHTVSFSTCAACRKDSILRGAQSGKDSPLNRFRRLSRLMAVCPCRKCSAVVCDTSPTALSWAVSPSLSPYSPATARNSGATANPAHDLCASVTAPTFALCVT